MAESRAPATEPQQPPLSEGVPLWLLALLGLVASFFGRGLTPALPGSSIGIERFISTTYGLTSILSQLVAAGAVAFVLRLAGSLLVERRLGIAYRAVALPSATAVAALTVAAAHDGLEGDMQSVLAIASLMSVAVSVPFGLLQRSTRAVSLALLLVGLSSGLRFAALSLAIRASETASASAYGVARGVSTAAWVAELGVLAFTLLWLGSRRGARMAALAGATLLFGFSLALVAREGLATDASPWAIVVARTFDELSRPPSPLVALPLRHIVEAALALCAVMCLFDRRRFAIGALFTLALIGRGAVDVPLSALLLCASALSVPLLALRSPDVPVSEGDVKASEAPAITAGS